MYFHTEDFGTFFLNLGRVCLNYPFNNQSRDPVDRRKSKLANLELSSNMLAMGEVKNIFFNVEENENIIEDRMMILLECKQRSFTTDEYGMMQGKGGRGNKQEEERKEVLCPYKVVVVDMGKLFIKLFAGRSIDSFDSEFIQVVDIAIPSAQFEEMIIHKTYFTRKYGIIG
jgi:hypothetical protein